MDFFTQHSISSDVKLIRMPVKVTVATVFQFSDVKKMSTSKLCTTLIVTIHILERQTFPKIPDHAASNTSTTRSPAPCYVTKGRELPNELTKTHQLLRTCSSFKTCVFILHVSNGFLLLHYGKVYSKALAGKGVHSLSLGHGTYQA